MKVAFLVRLLASHGVEVRSTSTRISLASMGKSQVAVEELQAEALGGLGVAVE